MGSREKHCAAPQTFENLEHNCLNYSAFPRRRQAPHCTHELPDPGYAVAKEVVAVTLRIERIMLEVAHVVLTAEENLSAVVVPVSKFVS